jgi:MFS family permease
MLAVSVGWQIYAMTGAALDLGLVGLAQFLPAFLLLLAAGHVADHYDRTRVIRISQMVEGLVAATLALGTVFGFLSRDVILVLIFILGAGRAFEAPTLQALLPALVPVQLLPRAVAASASANQTATIVGPALGGFIYVVSPTLAYAIACALFLAASALIALIRVERNLPPREPMAFRMLFAGIGFIRRNPVILGAISLDMFAVLLGGAMALLPIFARDIFEIGPWGLGLLRAAPALGALGMALVLARWPLRRAAGPKMFAAVTVYGLATLVFAFSTSFALSLVALIVLGSADMISVVVRQTLVPLLTPDDMRGRVNAVSALFIGTSNQLGDFRAGVMAQMFGAVGSVVIGGIGTLLIVAAWLKMFPALRNIDQLDRPPP